MSDNTGNSNGTEARRPQVPQDFDSSLQGILNFAISHTDGTLPSSNTHLEEMDPERRRFLSEFLDSMKGKDHLSAVKMALGTVLSESAPQDEKLEALEVIADEVEDLNVAQDFITLNGLAPLVALLASGNTEYKWRAADILARLVQNNPPCQRAAANYGMVNRILPLLAEEDSVVRLKAVHALSCMIRGNEDLLLDFLGNDMALDLVVGCLNRANPSPRLKLKTVVFLKTLLRASDKLNARYKQEGKEERPGITTADVAKQSVLVALTSALISEPSNSQLWEHTLQLLHILHQDELHVVTKLKEEVQQFIEVATARYEHIMALPEDARSAHNEEIQYHKDLFRLQLKLEFVTSAVIVVEF